MRQISLLVRFFVLFVVLSPLPGKCLFKITEDDQTYTLKSTLDEELEDLILPKELGLQFHLHDSKPPLQQDQESGEDVDDDDEKDDEHEEEAFESIPIVHENNINLILNPGSQALIDYQTALICSSPLEGCQFVKQTATFNDFTPQNLTDLTTRITAYLADKEGDPTHTFPVNHNEPQPEHLQNFLHHRLLEINQLTEDLTAQITRMAEINAEEDALSSKKGRVIRKQIEALELEAHRLFHAQTKSIIEALKDSALLMKTAPIMSLYLKIRALQHLQELYRLKAEKIVNFKQRFAQFDAVQTTLRREISEHAKVLSYYGDASFSVLTKPTQEFFGTILFEANTLYGNSPTALSYFEFYQQYSLDTPVTKQRLFETDLLAQLTRNKASNAEFEHLIFLANTLADQFPEMRKVPIKALSIPLSLCFKLGDEVRPFLEYLKSCPTEFSNDSTAKQFNAILQTVEGHLSYLSEEHEKAYRSHYNYIQSYIDRQGAHPYSKEVTQRAISEIVECHKTLDQPEKLNKLKNILIKYPDIKQFVEDTFPKIIQQGSNWIIIK